MTPNTNDSVHCIYTDNKLAVNLFLSRHTLPSGNQNTFKEQLFSSAKAKRLSVVLINFWSLIC